LRPTLALIYMGCMDECVYYDIRGKGRSGSSKCSNSVRHFWFSPLRHNIIFLTTYRLVDRALEILEHLALRGSVWPSACAIAIRDLRARLVGNKIHTKQAHSDSSNKFGKDQSGNISSGPTTHRPDSDNDFYDAPNSSTRWRESQTSRPRRPHSHSDHRMLPPWQDSGSSRDISSVQEDSNVSFPNDVSSGNFSSVPRPPGSPQNRVFSELMPSFRDAEGNGYVYRMGAELGLDLQMPNQDNAELFYGLDTPFWLNDDQWRGMDENT
jgi:hypothetical protein